MLLELQAVEARYDTSRVLFGVDMFIRENEVVSLLGRNGMGKTTTVRSMTGLLPVTAGKVLFCELVITRQEAFRIARLGMALAPEGRDIFPTLTVRENLVATANNRLKASSAVDPGAVEQMFPVLKERAGQRAGLLDEATEGLAPVVRRQVWDTLARLKGADLSMLVIDKNLDDLKTFADQHYVIDKGRILCAGSAHELGRDDQLVSSHLHL